MTKQIRYELVLTVVEDLHTGTGTGDAKVDAVQILSRYGLPVLRATHIKGLLRDIGWRLCALDDSFANKTELEQLFGEPKQRKRGALLMQSLRLCKEDSSPWRLTWISTARELDNRVPLPDTLRIQEYVAAGSVFKGELALLDESLLPLLKRCLKQMTHIGSQRSRDVGRVRVQLEPISVAKRSILQVPKKNKLPRLRLLLRNLDPISLPLTGHCGNLSPTACYIRGQQLLGAFASWAISQEQIGAAQLLLDRQISVGNAYPLPAIKLQEIQQCSVQPFPLHIYTPKHGKKQVQGPWWFGIGEGNALGSKGEVDKFNQNAELEEKPKRPGDTEFLFKLSQNQPWQRYSPQIQVHLRNRVPTKDWSDELFSEEEIAEDTLFLTDFSFPNQESAAEFIKAFLPVLQGETWLTMGRGGRPLQVDEAEWLSPEKTKKVKVKVKEFTLTLNSDLIARSPNLNFYDGLDPYMLAELVGMRANFNDKMEWQAICDTVEVRGFNAYSGLPRAPVLAIRRGSSICIEGGAEVNKLYQRLTELSYLGERTWEGFGRFELDFSPLSRLEVKTKVKVRKKVEMTPIGQSESLLEKAFNLVDAENKMPLPASGGEGGPTKTQWQFLRQQVNIAKDKTAVLRCIVDLENHAKKLGGQPWKKASLEEIKRIVDQDCQTLEEAQFFITSLVRKQWIKIKNA